MEPTSEVNSFHSMKLGGDWDSDCIVYLLYHTALLSRELTTGIQVLDNGSIVKEAFSPILGGLEGLFSVKIKKNNSFKDHAKLCKSCRIMAIFSYNLTYFSTIRRDSN